MDDITTNKYNTDYPETTVMVYRYLLPNNQYSARISNMFQLLAESFGLKNFEILDYRNIQNGPLVSWLMDRQIEWQKGEDVNLSEIYRALLVAGDFTSQERLMFETGSMEERIWAILLLITSPDLNI